MSWSSGYPRSTITLKPFYIQLHSSKTVGAMSAGQPGFQTHHSNLEPRWPRINGIAYARKSLPCWCFHKCIILCICDQHSRPASWSKNRRNMLKLNYIECFDGCTAGCSTETVKDVFPQESGVMRLCQARKLTKPCSGFRARQALEHITFG